MINKKISFFLHHSYIYISIQYNIYKRNYTTHTHTTYIKPFISYFIYTHIKVLISGSMNQFPSETQRKRKRVDNTEDEEEGASSKNRKVINFSFLERIKSIFGKKHISEIQTYKEVYNSIKKNKDIVKTVELKGENSMYVGRFTICEGKTFSSMMILCYLRNVDLKDIYLFYEGIKDNVVNMCITCDDDNDAPILHLHCVFPEKHAGIKIEYDYNGGERVNTGTNNNEGTQIYKMDDVRSELDEEQIRALHLKASGFLENNTCVTRYDSIPKKEFEGIKLVHFIPKVKIVGGEQRIYESFKNVSNSLIKRGYKAKIIPMTETRIKKGGKGNEGYLRTSGIIKALVLDLIYHMKDLHGLSEDCVSVSCKNKHVKVTFSIHKEEEGGGEEKEEEDVVKKDGSGEKDKYVDVYDKEGVKSMLVNILDDDK